MSSILAGSTRLLLSSSLIMRVARSSGRTPFRMPPYLPIGVLTASSTTASGRSFNPLDPRRAKTLIFFVEEKKSLAERELDEKILGILEAKGLSFSELLKRVPEARPLSVKLALDRLEKDGKAIRLVR